MKRCFALFLSLALLLSTISFSAFAAEMEQPSFDSLIQKACTAFPEYAEKMQNPQDITNTHSRNAAPRELLINETRPVSDKEYVTYAEYSDGLILLNSYEFTADTTTVNYVTGSTYRNITIDIEATCVNDLLYNGYFYLEGVSYSLRNSDYDVITNPGTASKSGNCVKSERTVYTKVESDEGYAQIAYDLWFRLGPTGYYDVRSELLIYVGEDTAVVDHLDRN